MNWETVITVICTMLGAGGTAAISLKAAGRKIIKDIQAARDVYAELKTEVDERISMCEKKAKKIESAYSQVVETQEKILATLRELLANRLCDNFEKIETSLESGKLEKLLWVSTKEMYDSYRANGWNHYTKDHWETLVRQITDICPNFEEKLKAARLKEFILVGDSNL